MIIEHKSIHKMHLHPCFSLHRPHVDLQLLLCVLRLPLLLSMIVTTFPLAAIFGIRLTCWLAEQSLTASFFNVIWKNCAGVNLLFLIFWCCRAHSYKVLETATVLRAFSWTSTKRTMLDW